METALEFTEEEKEFKKSVARFVQAEVAPLVEEIEKKEGIPRGLFKRIGEQDYFGLRYPAEYGGSSASFTLYLLMIEEFAKCSMSVAAALAMQSLMGTDFIFRFGTDDHKKRLLVPAVKGEKIAAFCLSEPAAGSDLANIQTTAREVAGGWVLQGSKMWVTNGTIADFFTVAATIDKSQGLKGIRFFLVERANKGLVVGRKISKMGTAGCDVTELALEQCLVAKDCMLGKGLEDLGKILDKIRVMTGALSVGLAQSALDQSINYSKQRICFNQPIAKFQAIQHKIADAAVELEAARLLVYQTARMIDKGIPCAKESAMAKLYASEVANRIADTATRIFAGYGYAKEYPVERYYRDARFLLYGGGTSEILKNIIAKQLLDL